MFDGDETWERHVRQQHTLEKAAATFARALPHSSARCITSSPHDSSLEIIVSRTPYNNMRSVINVRIIVNHKYAKHTRCVRCGMEIAASSSSGFVGADGLTLAAVARQMIDSSSSMLNNFCHVLIVIKYTGTRPLGFKEYTIPCLLSPLD